MLYINIMFDTHCHLNFKAFKNKEEQIINEAKNIGINFIVVPGTDYETSKKAVELAEKFPQVYAAIGIHPHHVFEITQNSNPKAKNLKNQISFSIKQIEKLITHPKVVAVGEVGLDRHLYQKTKYQNYQITEEFMELQKNFFLAQIQLAIKYKKTLIVHNRQAKNDLLTLLSDLNQSLSSLSVVFHCCEADNDLLKFALKNHIYIGVDGDVTYDKEKQEFIKKVPLELLVLETDAPFLLPEPLKSQKLYPNQPKNLYLIAQFIANLLNIKKEKLIQKTAENGRKLFKV